MQKNTAEEEMQKLLDDVNQKEERILFLSDRVEKKEMADVDMAAELQGLQAGEEEGRGSNASQTGDGCLEALWEQIAAVCAAVVQTRSMPWPMLSSKCSRKVEQFRSRCQEEMKEEGIVKMNKSKVEPVSKWRCPRQAGSFKA